YASEKSATLDAAGSLRVELIARDGTTTLLRESIPVQAGEIVDAAVMSRKALAAFIETEIERAREDGVLFSLHLKATMMKVSDPILFGVEVGAFYRDVLERHAAKLDALGFDPNNG